MYILGSKRQRHVADVCTPPCIQGNLGRKLLALVEFMESVYKIKLY